MDPITIFIVATLMMLANGGVLGLMHRDLPVSLRPCADLTGLPNRRALQAAGQERLAAAIAALALRLALVLIDVDHFKAVNDNHGHEIGGLPLHITISAGVALQSAADASLDHMLRRADHALYAAKRGGRNRVEMATD